MKRGIIAVEAGEYGTPENGGLNVAEQKVKNHVHRMLRKVGANDRLAVIELCRIQGWGFLVQIFVVQLDTQIHARGRVLRRDLL